MTPSQKSFLDKIGLAIRSISKNTGILSSVILSQAILESAWGNSTLAQEANNLFGIKADSNWKGTTKTVQTKEIRAENEVIEEAIFRSYPSLTQGIMDYGQFFTSTPWRKQNYQKFRQSDSYLQAVIELQKSGYATDPKYAEKLKSIIERYSLDKFDF
ncbi:TPA: glucosaminidase domain-containing protein [Streptococcus suis]|nr:glucosaminidase domain-containing protein [Streptococcus suis]